MQYVEDYSDERQKAWCIHCGDAIACTPANHDHVPTKSLLSKALRQRGADYDKGENDPEGYLPQVLICKKCNSGFSSDESYLLCVLHAVVAGSFYPDPSKYPDAATVLRSNRQIVRSLKAHPDGQLHLFENLLPFTVYPDVDRVKRVIVKNARGHAYHEIGEPLLGPPSWVQFSPLMSMSNEQIQNFESIGSGQDLWPEVGSRMMLRLVEGTSVAGGWIVVESGKYRYSVDWAEGITVRTVIWDYLATETRWDG